MDDKCIYIKLRNILKEKMDFWNQDIRDDDVTDFSAYDLAETIENLSEFKLYRYMPANYFNIRNIEIQTIHLSSNGVMNDVYEGIPACEKSDLTYSNLSKLKDLVYMTCLSECNNSTLMWSHYAKQHEGICLEYDFKRLRDDPYEIVNHLMPVDYVEKRRFYRDINRLIECSKDLQDAIDGHYVYDGEEPFDDIIPLFLTKSKEWEYEREWRIIFSKKQMYDVDDAVLYSGNIQMKCLSAVYLGYRVHPEVRKNIIEICKRISEKSEKISVFQARLDDVGYDILFGDDLLGND